MDYSEYVELLRSPYPRVVSEQALVLRALDIPYDIQHYDGVSVLLVPQAFLEFARQEIKAYAEKIETGRSNPNRW